MRATHGRIAACVAVAFVGGAMAACGDAGLRSLASNAPATPRSSSRPASPVGGMLTVDACTVLDLNTARTLTGDPAIAKASGGGTPGSTPDSSLCLYIDTSPTAGDSTSLIIQSIPGGSGASALQSALSQAVQHSNGRVQEVSGIGDAAFREVSAKSAALVIAKGNVQCILGAESHTRGGAAMEMELEALARILVSML